MAGIKKVLDNIDTGDIDIDDSDLTDDEKRAL